jgi:hypothetical protein
LTETFVLFLDQVSVFGVLGSFLEYIPVVQFIAVLKMLIENTQSAPEAISIGADACLFSLVPDIPFHSPRWLAFFSQSSHADAIRAQVDLNRACLRTAIKLLDRLQLRPLDGSSGDDSSHVVSRLFNRYSSILLKCLDICQLDLPVRSKARLESSSIF